MLGNLQVDWTIPKKKNKTDFHSRVPQHMAKMWATEGAVAYLARYIYIYICIAIAADMFRLPASRDSKTPLKQRQKFQGNRTARAKPDLNQIPWKIRLKFGQSQVLNRLKSCRNPLKLCVFRGTRRTPKRLKK